MKKSTLSWLFFIAFTMLLFFLIGVVLKNTAIITVASMTIEIGGIGIISYVFIKAKNFKYCWLKCRTSYCILYVG